MQQGKFKYRDDQGVVRTISYRRLAQLIGMKIEGVSRVCRGKRRPTPTTVKKMANALSLGARLRDDGQMELGLSTVSARSLNRQLGWPAFDGEWPAWADEKDEFKWVVNPSERIKA